jgi:hypothetical protein
MKTLWPISHLKLCLQTQHVSLSLLVVHTLLWAVTPRPTINQQQQMRRLVNLLPVSSLGMSDLLLVEKVTLLLEPCAAQQL